MRGHASRSARPEPDGGTELHLEGVTLLGPAGDRPALGGLALSFDRVGVNIGAAGSDPRVLGWDSIEGWRVDPDGDGGAVFSVRAPGRIYRFVAAGQDPAILGFLVDGIGRPPRTAAEPRPGSPRGAAHRPRGRRGWGRRSRGRLRWRPVLVTALVLAVAVAVALVLAQSAGAIHLPFLGSNGATVLGMAARPG